MKKLIYLTALMPLILGCNSNKNDDEAISTEDSLRTVSKEQQARISELDSGVQAFIEGYNAIQENLDLIKEKEKIISEAGKDAETRKNKSDEIVADIQAIYDALNQNKTRLAALQNRLASSTKKNDEAQKQLQLFINRLEAELQAKETQITDLKTQLEQLNVEMTNLRITYSETVQESALKTEKLNTAYYAFGTTKELINNGVLTKDGGFIGIGKTAKIKEDFNKSYFTKIDVTTTKSIILSSKKAKIITTHPASTYKIQGPEGKVERIVINNPEEFWAASKYLVIVTE